MVPLGRATCRIAEGHLPL